MFIDLLFPVRGQTLPLHHTPLLHAAICAFAPALHGDAVPWALHRVRGDALDGRLLLGPQSRVGLRLRSEDLPLAMGLAGQVLRVGEAQILLGTPNVRALQPAPRLVAWMVTLKGYTEAEPFFTRVIQELESLGLAGVLEPGRRRVLPIHGRSVVGYGVGLSQLEPAHSMQLQEQGLGGRRRLGCGVFVPSEHAPAQDVARPAGG